MMAVDADIEVEISSGSIPGEYAVRIVRAPAGGHASGRLDLDVDAVLNRLGDLEATVLASAALARRRTPVAERPVREVGQQLFQALFSREVYGTYRASLGAAQQSGRQLRLVLRLGAPQLAALPWEMLFDPETESYLCQTEPLLRHVPAPDYHLNPLEVVPPLRILGVIASPRGLPALDVETEKEHLARALAGPVAAGRIELAWAQHATWDEVHEQLLAGPWHVLHFIGHGDYDTATDEGQITLLRDDGRADSIEASRFVDLLSTARPVPRLVVLNSCYSGRSGDQDLFSGTAAALVRGGISAVAAMQFTVSDVGAVAFAHGFYAALANGRSIDEAARNGRISMRGKSGGTLEWVTPVLYVRGGSTELFTLTGPPAPRPAAAAQAAVPAAPPGPEPAEARIREARLRALYVQASAELRTSHYGPALELLDQLLALEPGYRDAAALRDTAADRLTAAQTYRQAREAEEGQDWRAAAAGYARLAEDPAFPDAAARRTRCEGRQRIAELEAELRYHADAGSWQAVLDVSAELEALDPAAADPDGLATAARARELTSRPLPLPRPRDEGGGAAASAEKPPVQASRPRTPGTGMPPAAPAAPADPGATAARGATPVAPDPVLLRCGGAVLAAAGLLAVWVINDMLYGNGTWGVEGLRVLLEFVVPAGYVLVFLAGLPDRTWWSRTLLGGAVLGAAAVGALVYFGAPETACLCEGADDLYFAPPAQVLGWVPFILAAAAGIQARHSFRRPRHLLPWVLLVPLALQPVLGVLFGGSGPLMVHLLVVAAAGATFIAASLHLKTGVKP